MLENDSGSQKSPWLLRGGSRQGTRHVRLNQNNQDACLYQCFSVPNYGKTYQVGLVSDGCSGQPGFSHSEIGAHLTLLYAYRRIQELICSGLSIDQIPMVLYPSVTEFLLDIMTKVMPVHIVWKYPVIIKDRENWNAQTRLKNDYLVATLLGFVSDGERLVTFSAGDGLVLMDNNLTIIDQNDRPDYPAISVNKPGNGFKTEVNDVNEIGRILIATDGLVQLIGDLGFREKIFEFNRGKALGLQTLLNISANQNPELMLDDCTVVTLERMVKGKEQSCT